MLKPRREMSDARNDWSQVRSLLVRALPLGLSSAVGSTQTNVPRYAIAALLGPAPLAVFAAISHIPLLGHLVVNAATQSALPLLAGDARTRRSSYQARLYGLVAMSVGFGSLALLMTIILGRRILGVIYGPEYADHAGVLVWLMATAVVTFASVFLGAGTTARGRFGAQLTISTVSFAFVAASIGPLVQRFGLIGAAWALLIGAIVELCAYAVLTAHDLGRTEAVPALVPRTLSSGGAGEPQRTKTIRVLHVFGCLDRGGAEMRAIELAEYFAGDRVHSDFVALTGRDGALDERVRAAGGEVIKCPLDRRFALAFYRLLKRGRYDVVHSHVHYSSGVILSIARAAGVRGRVAHLHTAVVNGRRNTLGRRTQLAICRGLLRRNATDIVACGEGTMQVAWGPNWAADPRCRVIYFGVRADRVRSAFRERTATPTVVNVASVQPLKNQARLIDMMRRLVKRVPGVELRLVGRELGDYGRKVRRAAADAGLADRISLIGEVSEPMPLMASAHLMVLPSLWEGVPCAALEACALGTPVLASDLPGTRELARHFPHLHLMSLHEDDEAWASAAERLINMRTPAFADAAERLAGTPFAFDRSCEAHYEVWSRPHV
jgi:glycosyltransferase involved in cell wall biosynthesis